MVMWVTARFVEPKEKKMCKGFVLSLFLGFSVLTAKNVFAESEESGALLVWTDKHRDTELASGYLYLPKRRNDLILQSVFLDVAPFQTAAFTLEFTDSKNFAGYVEEPFYREGMVVTFIQLRPDRLKDFKMISEYAPSNDEGLSLCVSQWEILLTDVQVILSK